MRELCQGCVHILTHTSSKLIALVKLGYSVSLLLARLLYKMMHIVNGNTVYYTNSTVTYITVNRGLSANTLGPNCTPTLLSTYLHKSSKL